MTENTQMNYRTQVLDAARVFWQQHTKSDALSMTMAELHADVELVIRAARGAAQAALKHPAVKPDMLVNGGALKLALNVLRRAGKNEVADELECTAQAAPVDAAVQALIDSAPTPFRRLGELLARTLDEDQWAHAQSLLLGGLVAVQEGRDIQGDIDRYNENMGQAMTDTNTLAPTDAEIDAIADQHKASGHGTVWPHAFARAVLACKWGTPAPASSEPVERQPLTEAQPVEEACDYCSDSGVVGLLDRAEPCPYCTPVKPAAQPTLTIKPLQWSDEREPSEDVRYNHVVAESPLGRITVEWKGWKKYDSHCVYVGGEYIDSGSTLEDAKKIAECYLQNAVEALTTAAPVDAATWQPIASAPKDGKAILLRSKNGRIADGLWSAANSHAGFWAWAYVHQEPVEWMPKPGSPAARAQEQQP